MKKTTYVAMNVYWFGIAFLWNSLHPIVLPALLLAFVPESRKNSYLGGLTFAGLVLAMIVQPLAGALSDRSRCRWGRRRPWMLAGTASSLLFLSLIPLAESFWSLLAIYLALQLASNVAHGPAQGLIPDLLPEERRGLGAGIKNLFDMLGLIAASVVAGRLIEGGQKALAVAVIGGGVAISAATTLLATPEPPTSAAAASPRTPLFQVDLRRFPNYTRLIVSRFFILVGIYAVQGFAQYFIRDRLAVPNPAEVTGSLMAVIGLALTAIVFPAGFLSDRLGRRSLNLGGGGLAALGIFLLVFARSVAALYVFAAVIGLAAGIFVSTNWAWATDLIPPQEAGKYLGFSNLATAGAGAASRLAGPLIDAVNNLRPGDYLGYPLLFLLASASAVLGTLLLLRVDEQ
ncbi:MAG: MFS transporter [Anaerolineae bacterium]|nr:MFS transporter [Anaerolineae bacterium]